MIEELRLPFPFLSDPDRSRAIEPYGVADPKDEREIALPSNVIVTPDGEEAFRFQSRDYADRLPEDALIEALEKLDLPATTQHPPVLGPAIPGPKAMPFEQLHTYYRGARFAVLAMMRRYPEMNEEAHLFIELMDRYMENVRRLFKEKKRS